MFSDQIMSVDKEKPIIEEDTSEEECEDEMITVTPFKIEPKSEVVYIFILINFIFLLRKEKA